MAHILLEKFPEVAREIRDALTQWLADPDAR